MTDEPTRPRTPRAGDPGDDPTRRSAAPPDDPQAALERLQSMGPGARGETGKRRTRAVSQPVTARARPRPAAASVARLNVARIAAPAVFLVAVIVLISILFQSGVLGGDDGQKVSQPGPVASKTPKKTASPKATGTASATKTYIVKAGDTPSGIADKYGISVTDLEELNPDKDFTTLVIGEKLKVPRE